MKLILRSKPDRRQGVVLLLVISMLALFAVVGLSFVFYADAESTSARIRRQSETQQIADLTQEKLLTYFLQQFIYDTDDANSKMAGHSLGRSMYGYPGGVIPFNGLGRPRDTSITLDNLQPIDNINVPYTYPDLNNAWLGAIDGQGRVLHRSFYRTNVDTSSGPPPTKWLSNFKTLRPAGFASNAEGDVRNVDGTQGVLDPDPNNAATFGQLQYVNDSFWMDLNHPIMITRDGVYYKPLFAPFIMDLDNRINLALAGNYLASYSSNAGSNTTPPPFFSRYGLGPWEINPLQLWGTSPSATTKTDLMNMLRGSAVTGAPARVGPTAGSSTPDNALPSGTLWFPSTNSYSKIPYQGTELSFLDAGTSTAASSGAGATSDPNGYRAIPNFNSQATTAKAAANWNPNWQDAAAGSNHPAMFDYFATNRFEPSGTNDDVRLALSNTEAILRYAEKGSPNVTSNLFRLFNTTLDPSSNRNVLNLLTSYSMSMHVPHLSPFGGDPNAATPYKYDMPANSRYPQVSDPQPSVPAAAILPVGEYNAYKQSRVAEALLGLGASAPIPKRQMRLAGVATTSLPTAQNIFDRLRVVCGMTTAVSSLSPGTNDYNANKFLAQLAVNIVDYLDADQTTTIFKWRTPAMGSQVSDDFVFGVEQPKLVINEVYASYDNNKNEPGLSDLTMPNSVQYLINVWVELHNITGADINSSDLLLGTGKSIYRLKLIKSTDVQNWVANSTIGDNPSTDISIGGSWQDWPATAKIQAGDQSTSSTGFYLVGPDVSSLPLFTDRVPAFTNTPDHKTDAMSTATKMPQLQFGAGGSKVGVAVLLQRLADPTRAEQNDPTVTSPAYNPYITIDYFDMNPPGDSSDPTGTDPTKRKNFISNSLKYVGMMDLSMTVSSLSSLSSAGRRQPLEGGYSTAGSVSNPVTQTGSAMGTEPNNTFKAQNNPNLLKPSGMASATPWAWYIHLDRMPLSPAELLNVPVVTPALVSNGLAATTGSSTGLAQGFPYAPSTLLGAMMDKKSLMTRVFDALIIPSFQYNAAINTQSEQIRVPGKININTVWDSKVLNALFDAQQNSVSFNGGTPAWFTKFTQTDVDSFYNNMLKKYRDSPAGGGIGGYSDTWLVDNPSGSNQVKIQNTLIDLMTQSSSLFTNTTANGRPYEREDAFRKIANNITFTSNAFAVWVTVGFFEVDPSNNFKFKTEPDPNNPVPGQTRPVEIGRIDSRNVRHRMFAIVDRSQMVLPTTTLVPSVNIKEVVPSGSSYEIRFDQIYFQSNAASLGYKFVPGMVVQVGTQVAKITSVNPAVQFPPPTGNKGPGLASITATFPVAPTTADSISFVPGLASAIGTNIVRPTGLDFGYPGPQPGFNLRDYDYIVPYWTVID